MPLRGQGQRQRQGQMTTITDDFMRQMLGKTREYSLVLLRYTPKRQEPGADRIVWEHGRRNFQLRAEGVLAIVGPGVKGTEMAGFGIFNATPERTRELMDGDPGVQAGLFTYEVLTVRGFPGDALPG